MQRLGQYTRHRCFISYHHADEIEVEQFINDFDHSRDIFISRGIGAAMSGDIIESSDSGYIMKRVRQLYLNNSSVTIVLVGRCTWSRRFVDWEVAASLRNTTNSLRNGLMAITLPSVQSHPTGLLPPRVAANVEGQGGYARYWKYPTSAHSLSVMIDDAYEARTTRAQLADNSLPLLVNSKQCS